MALQSFTAETLASYQVVLLDWLNREARLDLTPQELGDWVVAGGRLIALSGYADVVSDPLIVNALLQPQSLGFSTTGNLIRSARITAFAAHPITVGLDGRPEFRGIPFTGGWPVSFAEGDVPVMTLAGSVVAVAAVRGKGKAFVFGDEWITFDSEWVQVPEIERLWFNVFGWFGGCELSAPVVR